MSLEDFAADALMWIGRAIKLLPAIKELWQAVDGGNPAQELAAQLELTRQIRSQQAREEIEGR